MKRLVILSVILALSILPVTSKETKKSGKDEKRAQISEMTDTTIQELLADKSGATDLFDKAYSYAAVDGIVGATGHHGFTKNAAAGALAGALLVSLLEGKTTNIRRMHHLMCESGGHHDDEEV